MSKIIFNYNGQEVSIQCKTNEKMGDIFGRYTAKSQIKNEIFFLYNGNKVSDSMEYSQIINEEDRNRNIMNILVHEVYNENHQSNSNKNLFQSEEIICPECKQSSLIKIKDYKITLICKNGHFYNNILLNNFENAQNIDISQIVCDICKLNNKSTTYNNLMYTCFICNVNICPGCKIKHDKQHKIINFDEKNYICEKHYENYTKYCEDCKKNICIKCDIEHKDHKGIYYGGILPDIRENTELKEYIQKLKKEIEDIINKLKNIINNMDIYYRISHNKVKNNKNRNYNYLQNLNEFINYNNKIIKDIKEIIGDNNESHKFKNLMNIYDNINNIKNENNNYIIAEIEIKKDNVNKNIRIINSYEEYKRENKIDDSENDHKYKNEKEIKENCNIEIENEIIPFSYFYKFKKEGKYKIKYSFK